MQVLEFGRDFPGVARDHGFLWHRAICHRIFRRQAGHPPRAAEV